MVVLGYTVVQSTTFVLIFSFGYVSGGFRLVDCNTCLLMCRCPIFLFLDFSRVFFITFSVRPGQVFMKPFLNALKRLYVVGLNIAACKYWASYGLKCVPEYFLPRFLVVVALGVLLTVLSSCFWSVLLFLLHFFGWKVLVCLLWWSIHHHIEPPMILMVLSIFLGNVDLSCLFSYTWYL